MLKSNVLMALTLGGVMVLGCNKDDNKTPPAPPAPPAAPVPAPQAVTPPAAPDVSGPSTRPTVPEVVAPALPAAPTTAPSAPSADASTADAQSTLDKVEAAIKAKNWDDADSLLKKLEAMKDKLPPDLQSKVATLRTAIDAGKAIKLPGGLPGLPGDNK